MIFYNHLTGLDSEDGQRHCGLMCLWGTGSPESEGVGTALRHPSARPPSGACPAACSLAGLRVHSAVFHPFPIPCSWTIPGTFSNPGSGGQSSLSLWFLHHPTQSLPGNTSREVGPALCLCFCLPAIPSEAPADPFIAPGPTWQEQEAQQQLQISSGAWTRSCGPTT